MSLDPPDSPPAPEPGPPAWRAEAEGQGDYHVRAGRKGATRIHELIARGRLYEQEHRLKAGRQRLRQLIELGHVYEREHGLTPPKKKRRRQRLSRTERGQVLDGLLRRLMLMTKPSFRKELERMAEALNVSIGGEAGGVSVPCLRPPQRKETEGSVPTVLPAGAAAVEAGREVPSGPEGALRRAV